MVHDAPELDDPRWASLQPIRSRQRAERWQFVLHALGIESWVARVPEQSFYALLVPKREAERAVTELSEYEQENRERARQQVSRDKPLYNRSAMAIMIALSLAVFFVITGPVRGNSVWFQHGIADSHAMMHGAVYQSVTALTLHASTEHVMGNALVGGLFWVVSNKRFGQGLGTFLIVSTGAIGNIANAVFHEQVLLQHHRSLGASTAVMAALGLVVAAQIFSRHRSKDRPMRSILGWGPLLAGLVLLGIFGSSASSDLYAHGFGFLAGLVGGGAVAAILRNRTKPLTWPIQGAFGVATLGLVTSCWWLALS